MGTHELEQLRLLCHKLREAPILLLMIGIDVAGKCTYVLLMVKTHILNIKRYGVKTLREVLEGVAIVK